MITPVLQSIVKPLTVEQTINSLKWFERAKTTLAGGISSSARAITTGRIPHPIYITRGQGSKIWDADGNKFTDFLLSYGSLIMGHTAPRLCEAVIQQLKLGTMFATCNMLEVELAELICDMVPCAELVRFSNSGSEAILGALRAARGFTGKNRILKFEGHYHGWVDTMAISNRPAIHEVGNIELPNPVPNSQGISPSVIQDIVIAPWNEPELLVKILDLHTIKGETEFAAIICEPIVANNSCILPTPGYLEFLRDECTKRKIILIFDEVVTGFRINSGGAQQYYNVIPDMAVFSKALGGGFPISAFCGRHDIMNLIGQNTVKHGGTYNGNLLCAAASIITLRSIKQPDIVAHINNSGKKLMEAVRRASYDFNVPTHVQGVGSIFQIIFTDDTTAPFHNYRDLFRADTKKFAAFWQALFDQGIYANPLGTACWFTSAAHTEEDIEYTCGAIRNAIRSLV